MGLTHGTHFFARPWLSLTTDLGVNFLGPGLSFQRRLGMSQNHKAMSNSCLSTSVCCASWELRCPCTGAGLGWAAPASAAFLWHPKGTCFSISYTGAFPLKDFTVQVLKTWLSWKKKWGFLFKLSKSALSQRIHSSENWWDGEASLPSFLPLREGTLLPPCAGAVEMGL